MNWTQLLQQSIDLVTPLLMALVAYGVHQASAWLKARTTNELAHGIISRLDEAIVEVVREMHQTAVAQLKEAAADGKLSKSEAGKIRDTAIAKVRSYLGPKGVAELQRIVGPDIKAIIETKIESFLLDFVPAPPAEDDE